MHLTKFQKISILIVIIGIWINLPRFQNNVPDSKKLTSSENKRVEKTADFLLIFMRTPVGIVGFLIGMIVILSTHKNPEPKMIEYAAEDSSKESM